jgi:Ran GTPase-activating protein 1
VVEEFRALFLERGFGELDELDDMEEVSEDDEEEEESETEGVGQTTAARDILNNETKEEEEGRSADELVDMLTKTHIQ